MPDDCRALPLVKAAGRGDVERVKALIREGVKVSRFVFLDKWDTWPTTALHEAAKRGRTRVVRVLLAAGADFELGEGEDSDLTPLARAVTHGYVDVVKVLLERGARISAFAFGKAVASGKIELVGLLLKAGFSLKARGISLVSAVRRGQMKMVRFLVESGIPLNYQDSGSTALMVAAQRGQTEIARFLIEAGADLKARSLGNSTALILAARANNLPIVLALIEAGADGHVENEDGETAFSWARKLKNQKMLKLLESASVTKNTVECHAPLSERGSAPTAPTCEVTNRRVKRRPLSKAQSRQPAGVKAFVKVMRQGQAAWALAAIRAPIAKVSEALAALRKGGTWVYGVSMNPKPKEHEVVPRVVLVIKLRQHPWTIVFRSLFDLQADDLFGALEDAKQLSGRLKTCAITFAAEDTSGVVTYNIFEDGELLEHVEWENGGAFTDFDSAFRRKPCLSKVDDEYADRVFRSEGLYIPPCYPTGGRGTYQVALLGPRASTIERADVCTTNQ
jgi:ankyrin repeat protein